VLIGRNNPEECTSRLCAAAWFAHKRIPENTASC